MRPRNLKLQGFTCFSDAIEIDFSGMDVFVISGPTGAGKTTIIDAICYALYGKTPRGGEGMSLMAHNRDVMSVALEFEAGGGRYRVHRGINVTRKTGRDGKEKVTRSLSPAQLERLDSGDWDPIGDRVADIEKEIERIVGLDFDGFTRCVLLPQGQFAEFLSGDRAKRRGILVDLLEVGVYQRLMGRANARAASLGADADGYERTLREEYADATAEALATCRAELAEAAPKLDRARAERDALIEAQRLADAVKSARGRERSAAEEHAKKAGQAADEEAAAAKGQALERELADALKEKEAALQDVDYDRDRHHALGLALERARDVERRSTEADKAAAAASSTAKIDGAERAAGAAETQHAAAGAAHEAAEQALNHAQRTDAAAHLQSGLKPGDPCPVCGGVVGKLPKAAKSDVAAAEKKLSAARTAEQKAAKAAADASQALARERERHAQEVEAAKKAAADLTRAKDELAAVLPQGIAADATSIAAAYETEERAAMAVDALSRQISQQREALDAHRKRMTESAAMIAGLREAAAALLRESQAASAEADGSKRSLLELASRWQWDDVKSTIDAKKDPSGLIADMHRAANAAADALTQQLAQLEADATRIAQAIERVGEIRVKAGELRKTSGLYRELGVLLQANNFQDFVIEEAMRVLAESATEHLRLLAPRYEIVVDRTEFLVEDAWQAGRRRSAKTLSGGETFIASLALALALSERLPELRSAAATTLESLFLDEGFGTLDRESLETVMNALEGLRSEERMVGIITHVPELAQRIETRIEVRPAQSGSTIELTGALR